MIYRLIATILQQQCKINLTYILLITYCNTIKTSEKHMTV